MTVMVRSVPNKSDIFDLGFITRRDTFNHFSGINQVGGVKSEGIGDLAMCKNVVLTYAAVRVKLGSVRLQR